MKTAMQELYDLIYNKFHTKPNGYRIDTADVLTMIEKIGKPKEKQSVIDAYATGKSHEACGTTEEINKTGEQYYNETYKQ
jgi:hypothetical protein